MIKIEIVERKAAYKLAQADKVYPASGGDTTIKEGVFRYNASEMEGLYKDTALSEKALFFWVERLGVEGGALVPTGDYYQLWISSLTRVGIPMIQVNNEIVRDETIEIARADGDMASQYRNSGTVASFLNSIDGKPFNIFLNAEVKTSAFDRATGKPSLTKLRNLKVYTFEFEKKLKLKAEAKS